jgi:HAD superfamily hydrolase (TIGR01509 family)
MIRAMIFDLDGTLVNTEYLKSISYARAIVQLSDGRVDEATAQDAFKDVVGRSRKEVARYLAEKFGLNGACEALCDQYGVEERWEVLSAMRLSLYTDILRDPNSLRENLWPHNVDLLRLAKETLCKVGLATMSERMQAERVLEMLELREYFHCVATVDDVQKTKPDPEIYLTVSRWLGVSPPECLVIEDSPSGVRSGLAAGMNVIAVATDFTQDQLLALADIDNRWVVTDPRTFPDVVRERIELSRTGPDDEAICGIAGPTRARGSRSIYVEN